LAAETFFERKKEKIEKAVEGEIRKEKMKAKRRRGARVYFLFVCVCVCMCVSVCGISRQVILLTSQEKKGHRKVNIYYIKKEAAKS